MSEIIVLLSFISFTTLPSSSYSKRPYPLLQNPGIIYNEMLGPIISTVLQS